jgi:hypothetical protein
LAEQLFEFFRCAVQLRFNVSMHRKLVKSMPPLRVTVLRTRPKTYRKIVYLLADPYWSALQISKACRVSEHTVRAIREREAKTIAERKQRLISLFGNVAEMSAERMEELCGKASLRDAGVSAGIATDKMLALLGETPSALSVEVTLGDQEKVNAIHRRMVALLTGKEPEPDGA